MRRRRLRPPPRALLRALPAAVPLKKRSKKTPRTTRPVHRPARRRVRRRRVLPLPRHLRLPQAAHRVRATRYARVARTRAATPRRPPKSRRACPSRGESLRRSRPKHRSTRLATETDRLLERTNVSTDARISSRFLSSSQSE